MNPPRPPGPQAPQSPQGPPAPPHLDDLIARARAALPPPAPPPFAQVMARIDAEGALPGPVRLWRRMSEVRPARRWAAVAATLLAVGGSVSLWGPRGSPSTDPAAPGAIVLEIAPSVRVLREGRPLAPNGTSLIATAGDEVVADGAATLRLGDRTAIELEPRARLRLGGLDAVEMLDGRATFYVRHHPTRSFLVATASVSVIDRGTRFAVEVSADPAGERVLVTVEQGRVEVFPTEVEARPSWELAAGEGLAFVAGKATGAPFALGARPTLSLEAEDVAPARDRPVVVRLVFDNPTDGWLALPAYDPVRAPLHVEVRTPDGGVLAVRVSEAMLVEGGGSGRSLPPRGRLVLRVRFEHTFASPGTYRLRAIYRPAGAVDEGASPELVLPVR